MPQDYFARRVTLTNANQTYRLSDLIQVVESGAPLGGNEVYLEMPDDSPGGGRIVRGDANLAAMSDGQPFSPAISTRTAGKDTTRIFVRTDTAGAQLFVEITQN